MSLFGCNSIQFFCMTWNRSKWQEYIISEEKLDSHINHDVYVLQKPEESLTNLTDKLTNLGLCVVFRLKRVLLNLNVLWDK